MQYVSQNGAHPHVMGVLDVLQDETTCLCSCLFVRREIYLGSCNRRVASLNQWQDIGSVNFWRYVFVYLCFSLEISVPILCM
jgi:hypothetical protein